MNHSLCRPIGFIGTAFLPDSADGRKEVEKWMDGLTFR